MKHLEIKVIGKVQGVWFRANTKDIAGKLNLSGFVQNKPDGSVYIEASGEEEAIEKFIQWLRKGPELARVDKLEIEENNKEYNSGFEIKR